MRETQRERECECERERERESASERERKRERDRERKQTIHMDSPFHLRAHIRSDIHLQVGVFFVSCLLRPPPPAVVVPVSVVVDGDNLYAAERQGDHDGTRKEDGREIEAVITRAWEGEEEVEEEEKEAINKKGDLCVIREATAP